VAPRDQDVRHLGQVGADVAALDVLAQPDGERVVVAVGGPRTEHVAERHIFPVAVGHLDADRALARDRADDPHVGRLDRVGDVAGQLGDPLDLDARPELDLVARDGRAAGEPGDRGVHVELVEHAGQGGDHLVVGLAPGARCLTGREHVGGWQLVGRIGERQLLHAFLRRRRRVRGRRLPAGRAVRRPRQGDRVVRDLAIEVVVKRPGRDRPGLDAIHRGGDPPARAGAAARRGDRLVLFVIAGFVQFVAGNEGAGTPTHRDVPQLGEPLRDPVDRRRGG